METNKSYYAVIFTSTRTNVKEGYDEMAKKMSDLAAQQEGFLGEESSPGITISYWKDLQSIKKWKEHPEHKIAQKLGKEKWYSSYRTRITKVEKEYSFKK